MIPGQLRHEPVEVQAGLRRVLLVDEALPVRRKLADILARAGLAPEQVRSAASGEEGLEAFTLHRPDVVFTELVGRDAEAGLAMLEEMLTIDPQTRVVLVTAEPADSPAVRAAVRMGVFAVIPKPLRHEKIRQVLSEIESEEGGIERFR